MKSLTLLFSLLILLNQSAFADVERKRARLFKMVTTQNVLYFDSGYRNASGVCQPSQVALCVPNSAERSELLEAQKCEGDINIKNSYKFSNGEVPAQFDNSRFDFRFAETSRVNSHFNGQVVYDDVPLTEQEESDRCFSGKFYRELVFTAICAR
ncbi:MAG: hypothetical protein HRU19_20950 [Pseudobacteriovorax sp.]|nr:hypothetical protein [Pseudobacteriovorax sp.]